MQLQHNLKMDYKRTMLIGLGFFASSLLWSIYNSFVPLILQDYITSTATVGLIMTFDNVFGVIFQPYFGARSDRTRTRFGRRMPYVLTGAPICALLFALIPHMQVLWLLMLVIIVFNFGMSIWRAPMIALMPDLMPDSQRSAANGVINLMGGIASIIAFLGGGLIANAYGRGATFLMGSVVMILAVVVLVLTIRENKLEPILLDPIHILTQGDQGDQAESASEGIVVRLAGFRSLSAVSKKNLFFLLLAIFFWFSAYNAVETFFTSYATQELGQTEGQAAMLLAFFSISFVIFAVPSGFLANRIGRQKIVVGGLVGTILVFIPLFFVDNLWAIRGLLMVGGMFWAGININALPMVLEHGNENEMGTFTGYYYLFSFSASIISPILFGLVRDITGSFQSLFIYATIAFLLALLAILKVAHRNRPVDEPAA